MPNLKLTDLPEISNLNLDSSNLLYIVNPAGVGTSSKITYSNLVGTKVSTISTGLIAFENQSTLNLNFLSGEIKTNQDSIEALDAGAAADITRFNLLSGSVDVNTALVQTLCAEVEDQDVTYLVTDVAVISANLSALSADFESIYQTEDDISFLAGVSALNLSKFNNLASVSALNLSKFNNLASVSALNLSKFNTLAGLSALNLSKFNNLASVSALNLSKFNTLASVSALNLSKFNTLAGLSAIDILSGANVTSNNILATTTLGYKSGTGGTVTQSSSKTTGVTLNKINGEIVMNGAELVDDATAAFTLTNSTIAATDVVIVNVASVGTAGAYQVTVGAVAAGSCSISVLNVSGGPLSQAIKLNFAVIKSVAS